MSRLIDQLLQRKKKQTYIIAEIGSNFNGDLEIAKKSIDAAVDCGANAVKFQTFKADEFVADKNLTYTYQTLTGEMVTETQYEMFKKLELPDEWHFELNQYANSKNVDFLSSAADRNAVDLLIELKVPIIKLASEDLINIALIEYVASKRYPTMLSTGMADEYEIDNALDIFEKNGSNDVIILHCVSQYPTPVKDASLARISALKKYNIPVGYSDHTEGWLAPMLSIAYGTCVIEKHFTLDKKLPGPDHKMAADPREFKKLVEMVRLAELIHGNETLHFHPSEQEARFEFRRSIVVKKDISKGTVIKENMLAYKRPGQGLKPYQKDLIIGKTLILDVKLNQQIKLDMVE